MRLHQAVKQLIRERRDGTRPPAVYPEPTPYVPMTAAELIEYIEPSESDEEEYRFDRTERRLICEALRNYIQGIA